MWTSVCSDGDICQGGKCPYVSECFYFKAKKRLAEASVIICNHHLLFVDSASRLEDCLEYSEEAVLPPFRHLVVDEAHNMERHATDLFTETYSSYSLRRQMEYIYDTTLGGDVFPTLRQQDPRTWVPQLKLFLDRDEASFRSQADKVLKRFFDGLSMYWARHSWATLAAELEIPIETIAAALGHNYGSRVTNVYINFNQKKIDEANRRVIDYLLKQD